MCFVPMLFIFGRESSPKHGETTASIPFMRLRKFIIIIITIIIRKPHSSGDTNRRDVYEKHFILQGDVPQSKDA